MAHGFIEVDGVRARDLPAHLEDGKTGDRVALLDGGLLHVKEGHASFVRWSEVLGVVEHGGAAHVLVPRRAPAPPWLEVDASMLGGERGSVRAFVERLENRCANGGMGGYRDAVRQRRQDLGPRVLLERVAARETVPGALEVPSTIMLGVSYPGLALAQLGILGLGTILGYALMVAVVPGGTRNASALSLLGTGLMMATMVGSGWVAFLVGRAWRAAKNRTLPRQRVLVLAPDGCIVGFRGGVRALAWSEVQAFGIGRDPDTYDEALVVTGLDGAPLGTLQSAWLDAPLGLVVRVAQAYRSAALEREES